MFSCQMVPIQYCVDNPPFKTSLKIILNTGSGDKCLVAVSLNIPTIFRLLTFVCMGGFVELLNKIDNMLCYYHKRIYDTIRAVCSLRDRVPQSETKLLPSKMRIDGNPTCIILELIYKNSKVKR